MPRESTPEGQTIRKWRRAFSYAYWVFAVSVGVWVTVSIAAVHCGFREDASQRMNTAAQARPDRAIRARQCHRQLERLLMDLRERALKLQTRAVRWDFDPAHEWGKWSDSWARRWQLAGGRCGFDQGQLGGADAKAIEQLQSAHRALGKLHASYSELMQHFASRYVAGFRHVRGQLVSAKRTLAHVTVGTKTTD